MSGSVKNIRGVCFFLRTFVTALLVYIRQKEKFALEIAARLASVNESLITGW
jgi:hypothetical protein